MPPVVPLGRVQDRAERHPPILRSGRSDFNARFIAARRIYPDLQADTFTEFLRTGVDDLLRAVEAIDSNRLGEVTMAAYDAALELVGHR